MPNFAFGGVTSSDFWVISVDRNRYKESLLPGSTTLFTFNQLVNSIN
jgi:hypothetical protein